jgi:hypothetical protein
MVAILLCMVSAVLRKARGDETFALVRLLAKPVAILSMAAVAGVTTAAVAARAAEPAGLVEYVTGEGFAEAGESRRSLKRDATIFMADTVGTGPVSRLGMQLGQRTRLRLGEQARITIDQYLVEASGEFTLHRGPMLFDRPESTRSAVRVRSPFALIAVRGTRFFAGPSGGVFGVFVERGTLAVRAGGREVILGPGEGTDIRRPGDPPTPARRWGAQRIQSALDSVL